MSSLTVHILSVITFAILCAFASGFHISLNPPSLSNNPEYEDILRIKRQVETFDDDFPTAPTSETQAEETGFWDRVINVALKLFNKFIEWLNN